MPAAGWSQPCLNSWTINRVFYCALRRARLNVAQCKLYTLCAGMLSFSMVSCGSATIVEFLSYMATHRVQKIDVQGYASTLGEPFGF